MTVIKGSDLTGLNQDLLMDESNMPDSWCEIAYIPEKLEEAGEAVEICASKRIPYTISSARTG
ncbi:hypothetical protein JXA84_03095, partial [candidate division WOR-3 bacterium]|nr:hypothetical protein [candidate division WOR-3 bacterium]